MRSLICLLSVLVISCETARPVPVEPSRLETSKVAGEVARLPSSAPLDFGGVAFLGDRLYASTNIGIFEAGPRGLECVDRWHPTYNVTSAGWPDFTRRAIWFYDEENMTFLRVCDGAWTRIALPERRGKTPTRGDVLEGFHLSAGKAGVWVAGRGDVWRRDFEREEWILEPDLPQGTTPTRVAALDRGLLVVASMEGGIGGDIKDRLGLGAKSDRVFFLGEDGWKEVSNPVGSFRTRQAVGSPGWCYLITMDHRVLQADPGGISVLSTPDRCETLAVDPESHLWGSFPGRGIYRYGGTDGWELRLPHPHEKSERWERPHLATNGTLVAYSSCTVPEFQGYRMTRLGSPGLWRSEGDSWKRVTW